MKRKFIFLVPFLSLMGCAEYERQNIAGVYEVIPVESIEYRLDDDIAVPTPHDIPGLEDEDPRGYVLMAVNRHEFYRQHGIKLPENSDIIPNKKSHISDYEFQKFHYEIARLMNHLRSDAIIDIDDNQLIKISKSIKSFSDKVLSGINLNNEATLSTINPIKSNALWRGVDEKTVYLLNLSKTIESDNYANKISESSPHIDIYDGIVRDIEGIVKEVKNRNAVSITPSLRLLEARILEWEYILSNSLVLSRNEESYDDDRRLRHLLIAKTMLVRLGLVDLARQWKANQNNLIPDGLPTLIYKK